MRYFCSLCLLFLDSSTVRQHNANCPIKRELTAPFRRRDRQTRYADPCRVFLPEYDAIAYAERRGNKVPDAAAKPRLFAEESL